MDRNEKLRLSADRTHCYCFKHGLFSRFMDHSLYWFIYTVKALKPMLEKVKDGDPLLYG
jgi:hypothetical protein